ncbi:putative FMN-dependent luciferase-like monooxygenase, KPN_01858 family [Agrococcus baldri]|uniref:FMN-dependent luciferase-like monooxygenase, KPN_01858 family n=1 Tax=Agrococcus baldri TaxID=153730 RepID=A0AA94HPI1_9MICO|nr:LLM class flavin-dependent oxidoreductase [Agrococcus baldri]SFS18019.1 putative FMN-dependent luciferase-like monooxygenase, KPN_01858 family [Agrococcus baldri]
MAPTIGFFTRVLDDAAAAERYRIALEQIELAESLGFETAWVAQHHLDGAEGGLPSPFVLLAAAAARTARIRLGTAILTLAHEHPARAAEDAVVLDTIAGGRAELGLGTGGSPRTLSAFGEDPGQRRAIYDAKLVRLRSLIAGTADESLYPQQQTGLEGRIWQATFSPEGAGAIGAQGDGLMLSRVQPIPSEHTGDVPPRVWEVQRRLVDAYLDALPSGVAPRVLASRSVVVVDPADRSAVRAHAEAGIGAQVAQLHGITPGSLSLDELLVRSETHLGTPAEVIDSLAADTVAAGATEVSIQVHSVDPDASITNRSLELFAREVAPALGWRVAIEPQEARRVA